MTADAAAVDAFLAAHGRAVVKPVDGFSGRGVFVLAAGDPNVASIVETRHLRGDPLGAACSPTWPRSSTATSGSTSSTARRWAPPCGSRCRATSGSSARTPRLQLTARDREICARLAPTLRRHGLRMVGLDVIGDHLIEVNTTSPGALRKADGLLGTTYCADLVHHVLTHPTWR